MKSKLEKCCNSYGTLKSLSWKGVAILLCAICLFGFTSPVMADVLSIEAQLQQPIVSGVISDDSGLGLPGVNVLVKGTTIGVVTDMDGKYTVKVPNASSVIQYSYMGYITQEVTVGSQSVIDVVLKENVIAMQEVVVTALGMKRQAKALSYSATEVKGEELGQTSDANLINSLQGRIAGVSIDINGSDMAGAAANIMIRGNTTVTGSGSPMFVVDGLPASSSDLTSINPNDVESMSVSKGAAATALYGSRASNGLIIINTKRGTPQKGVGIAYSGRIGLETFNDPMRGRQTLYGTSGMNGDNSDTYPSFWNEETHRAWGPRYDGRDLGINFNYDPNYPLKHEYKENHWKEFMRTGVNYSNSLSFSGGNDKQRFRFSASDYRYEAPIPNANMNRQTVNFTTNSKFGNRITLDAGVRFTKSTTNNNPNNTDRYLRILAMIPTSWDINWLKGTTPKLGAREDGTMLPWSTNDYYPNPFWSAYQNSAKNSSDRLTAYASLRYDITDWLYINGRIQLSDDTSYRTNITAYGDARTNNGTGNVQEYENYGRDIDADWSLVFNKAFGKFNVNALFGGALTRTKSENTGISGSTLIVPYYHVVTNATATTYSPNVGFSKYGMNSLYGSAEVSYEDFLYLTLTGRNDWFSSLHPDHNSLFYPSVGLSYIFTNHFKTPEWLSFGKLRGSWANVGGGASAYSTKFGYSLSAAGYMNNPTLSIPSTIPNPFIKPYRTREYEIGVDLRFIENRIGLDYAYYDKETTDDIVNVSLPNSSSYTSAKVNLGAISNRGHELALTFVPVVGDFRWEMNLVYSYNMSKILNLGESDEVQIASFSEGGGGSVKQVVGQRANGIYGYKQQTTEDGTPIWERWTFNYDGQTHNSWRPARGATQELLGFGGNPNMGSFTTTFSYKGFTLSAMLDAKWGGKMVYLAEQEMVERGQSVQTLPGRDGGLFIQGVYKDESGNYVDVASAPGYTINANPAQNRPQPITVAGNEIPYNVKHFENYYREGHVKRVADMILFDASYVQLREVSLMYNLPKTLLTKWKLPVQSVRMSLVGRNLLDIYNDLPNGDPSTVRGSTGINNFALPSTRSFTFNLDVSF